MADLANPDSFAVYKGRVRGAWVLLKPSTPVWNPDAPPPTPEDSARVTAILWERAQLSADTSAEAVRARRQWTIDLPYLLKAEGALGTLVDGAKEHALMTMSGSPNRVSPLPNLVISHEDYTHFERLITAGITPAPGGESREQAGEDPGPAVEHRRRDPRQRAAGADRDSRRPPR